MAIKITETEKKVTPAKKTFKFEDILVDKLALVDSQGTDLTEEFKAALPEGIETLTFKITVTLDDPTEY